MTQGISRTDSTMGELADAGQRTLQIGADNPIRISSGHRILHHDGKCSRPHGHNYEITVKVTGELTDEGWVVDKGDVTDVIDAWDHRFLVEAGSTSSRTRCRMCRCRCVKPGSSVRRTDAGC